MRRAHAQSDFPVFPQKGSLDAHHEEEPCKLNDELLLGAMLLTKRYAASAHIKLV
jgi:hypothetical protein